MNPNASSNATAEGSNRKFDGVAVSASILLASTVIGGLIGFLCFIAIGIAISGTVPDGMTATDALPYSSTVCLLPPLVAPLVMRTRTFDPAMFLAVSGLIFATFAWTLFNLAIRSAVFVHPNFAHRIPDALRSIDCSVSVVVGILVLSVSAWLHFHSRNATDNHAIHRRTA